MSFRMQNKYGIYMELCRVHARAFLMIENTGPEDGISSESIVF